ncbi:MAG TPA: methyltransferase domain-containing protein [Pilimelia sp.]|nr:methyltransferase domain-containing protein [Pilimelia sp.]
MADTAAPSAEEVGVYYDEMADFAKLLFGDSIHMGYWDDEAGQTVSEAQDRLTQVIIDTTGASAGQRLIDVGSGTGRPAVLLAQQTGASIVGINVSVGQVASATALARDSGVSDLVTFAVADAMDIPYPEGSFDLVWAMESLSHMKDRVAALREMQRVLKVGGRLVVTDISEIAEMDPGDRELLFTCFLMSSLEAHDRYPEVVREAGFELVAVHDLTPRVNTTLERVAEGYVQKRDKIVARYGEDFAREVDGDFPRLGAAMRNCLGYLLIVARKPAA